MANQGDSDKRLKYGSHINGVFNQTESLNVAIY